ncbi:TPA: thioredoxin [Candidatus Poribacteria bacterium]|nr:thioredoxin [Candidatus Poribacteria bacterium]
MASGNIMHITDDNFEREVIRSDLPVLVDFWAEWCGPCLMLAPIIEQIAQEYDGRLKVGKLNVDEHGPLAVRYGIRGIPTLTLLKGGKPVSQLIGVTPKSEIKRWLDEQI